MKRSILIGRWSPFHDGHAALVNLLFGEGRQVAIGIRDTRMDPDNPYSVYERRKMIGQVFGDRVPTFVVPDFDEMCYGREVGYSFRQLSLPPEIEAVSGTDSRMKSRIVWLTGNSGSGKTTLADGLRARFPEAVNLDGDAMRRSISVEAGFSLCDRERHNVRVARLAKVLADQGHLVVVSVIAPTDRIRRAVEEVVRPVWVYVKRALPRDPDRPYEAPASPDITVDNNIMGHETALAYLIERLQGI